MMKLLLLSILCVAAVSAQEGTILQVLEEIGATELLRALRDVPLMQTLSESGPFTVFAPSNRAISEIPLEIKLAFLRNKTLLNDFLSYHVVPGSYQSSSLTTNDVTIPSLLRSKGVRINVYNLLTGTEITAEGAEIVRPDNLATNGVVHLVDKVFLPVPEGTILDMLTFDFLFTRLNEGIIRAGLSSTLNTTIPFTLFAPDNRAFDKLPAGTWEKLLNNVTALTNVLTYHLLKGTYYTEGFNPEQDVPTVQGNTLRITRQEFLTEVNGFIVDLPNLSVYNGVVHVINDVLIPPNLHIN